MVTFWAEALGYVPEPPPAGHATWRAYWAATGVPESRATGRRRGCPGVDRRPNWTRTEGVVPAGSRTEGWQEPVASRSEGQWWP
ncbi:hypothetical protein [Actinoalloteichus caeruleus]|uniref:hypothetical protein n=1 Tax=Actinoalloteichus cyanogriseus TaxID=2893586 RepID=UPI003BB85370